MGNTRLIHVRQKDLAIKTKTEIVNAVNKMGFRHIDLDSSWDEINDALESVESIGYRITVQSLYPHKTIDVLNLYTQFERLDDIPIVCQDVPGEIYANTSMPVGASNNITITFE